MAVLGERVLRLRMEDGKTALSVTIFTEDSRLCAGLGRWYGPLLRLMVRIGIVLKSAISEPLMASQDLLRILGVG